MQQAEKLSVDQIRAESGEVLSGFRQIYEPGVYNREPSEPG
jgi:hypothetical protein